MSPIPDHNKLFSTASSNTVKNRLKKSSQQNAIQEKENFNNDTERKLSQGVSFTRNHQENSRYGITTKSLVLITVHLSYHTQCEVHACTLHCATRELPGDALVNTNTTCLLCINFLFQS